jgi:hypothetical protein
MTLRIPFPKSRILTLSSRSSSPTLDRAISQTSSLRLLVSLDAVKEAQHGLQETFDDENEDQKRITPPRHRYHLMARS